MIQTNTREVSGLVKAEGTRLVNGEGKEILLRGVGLGSWLLPEGYMWMFPEQGDRPRRMEQQLVSLIGQENADLFWNIYFERYISEDDIKQIATEGFNSVRVPINARILIQDNSPLTPLQYREDRLGLIDRVIAWCREHNLYVILDLHGAPGGQTGTNIDDSKNNLPELFIDERNRQMTIELWRMLADRYKNEWIVAGYDLLNEPLPEWFSKYNGLVMPLYRDIIQAIREVDPHHMIILEGVHWSTDWSIFGDKLDDNVMLQFHKYWNNPDKNSIQHYLDKREEWNVPIFMGEGGENNILWYAGAFQLYEEHDISWNFWTWKKINTTNSPCSIPMPAEWNLITAYLEGGAKPDPENAQRILWEYLDHLPFHKNHYHPEVVRSLFRLAPVKIPAIFYGSDGEGISYGLQRQRTSRTVQFRVDEGTEIRFVEETPDSKVNFQHGQGQDWKQEEWLCVRLEPGEWLAYDFITRWGEGQEEYMLTTSILAEQSHGELSLVLNEQELGVIQPETVGQWKNASLDSSFLLSSGQHKIILKAVNSPIVVQWIEVNIITAIN